MSGTTLYAVPASSFAPDGSSPAGIAALVAMAIAAERRSEKEMASATDRARHYALCVTIKRIVAAEARHVVAEPRDLSSTVEEVAALRIDDDTFSDLVAADWRRDASGPRRDHGALGAAFLRPEDVAQQISALGELTSSAVADASVERRRTFLTACARAGCGVIEVADPEAPSAVRQATTPRRSTTAPVVAGEQPSDRSLEARLRAFTAGGLPVSFGSGARHEEITVALHALVHSEGRGLLPILYSDGSQAADFPVGCLNLRQQAAPEDALRLGLMSMRHPELDQLVDGYWFRNKAVSQPRTLADTDAFCFREARAHLGELHRRDVRFIDLYHTGYEPVVIGFYRALVEHQRDDEAPLSVRPVFLDQRGYRPGRTWSGARRDAT